jgi:hypothetical protein
MDIQEFQCWHAPYPEDCPRCTDWLVPQRKTGEYYLASAWNQELVTHHAETLPKSPVFLALQGLTTFHALPWPCLQ